MNATCCLATGLLVILPAVAPAAPASLKGKVYPAEHNIFAAPESGLEVIQLTTHPADDSALYFTGNSFGPDDSGLVFASRRTGAWNLFYLDLKTFGFVQLTDGQNISGIGAEVAPGAREVFYRDRPDIKAVHLQTLAERTIITAPEGYTMSAAVSVMPSGEAFDVNLTAAFRWARNSPAGSSRESRPARSSASRRCFRIRAECGWSPAPPPKARCTA